jgi:L-asparaginase II
MRYNNSYLPIFEFTRGGMVESTHYGAAAVVDSQGKLVASYGDPTTRTFLRSSAKPFQAIPLVENGGIERYHLDLKEVALICASHSGTDEHVTTVEGIQEKTGVAEAELLCGIHPPYHTETAEAMRKRGEEPTPNRHNCSGKHTGMLAYARMKAAFNDNDPNGNTQLEYLNNAHPIQSDILNAFSEMCRVPKDEIVLGIDGCSAPNFAVPLFNSALGFARLCDPSGLPDKRAQACRRITEAMSEYPDMVGGPDSFDTLLMQTLKGRVISKGGAEGYLAMGIFPGALGEGSPAVGISIKISDGDIGAHVPAKYGYAGRVRPAAALEILRQLGAISPSELESLATFGPVYPLHNWRNTAVGDARPCFTLVRAN